MVAQVVNWEDVSVHFGSFLSFVIVETSGDGVLWHGGRS